MQSRPGLTLLEAMVALVIIGLTGVTALAAVAAEVRSADRARHGLEAAALAAHQLERIALLPSRDMLPLPDSLVHGAFAAPLDAYRWSASTRAGRTDRSLIDVDVRVEWNDGSYALSTRLYRVAGGGE